MPSEVERLIGKRIAALRKERNLTQAGLAEYIGVTTETISRLERGVSVPSLKTLEGISNVMEVPLKDLFNFRYPKNTKKFPQEREISKIIAFLKYKKEDEVKMAYKILRGVFDAVKRK
ncbi:MAG: helix-turn-helix transcriptional regulator [Deltaproteobacteria bacterium]